MCGSSLTLFWNSPNKDVGQHLIGWNHLAESAVALATLCEEARPVLHARAARLAKAKAAVPAGAAGVDDVQIDELIVLLDDQDLSAIDKFAEHEASLIAMLEPVRF